LESTRKADREDELRDGFGSESAAEKRGGSKDLSGLMMIGGIKILLPLA
jgi:hypothetical protein